MSPYHFKQQAYRHAVIGMRFPDNLADQMVGIMAAREAQTDVPLDPDGVFDVREDALYAIGRCCNIVLTTRDIVDKMNLAFELDVDLPILLSYLEDLEEYVVFVQGQLHKSYVNFGGIVEMTCPAKTLCLINLRLFIQ